jgi:ATP-dependent helicase/nuclease subunit A
MRQPSLFETPAGTTVDRPADQAARDFAVDPANFVVLEASAGTGKTRVLVERYVRLIASGVEPRNILAMTFTRKAAAEMRDRVLVELRRRAERGELPAARWRDLQSRVAEIEISTIDAFCFGLLREFPLEADVDPAFEIADETEVARFANEALDLTLRAARTLVVDDERVRLLFTRVKQPILREALGALLDRRQLALPAVATFVRTRAVCEDAGAAAHRFSARLRDLLRHSPHRGALLDDGPIASAEFDWLRADLMAVCPPSPQSADAGRVAPNRLQSLRRRLERHFLTQAGRPRQKLAKTLTVDRFASADARRRHEQAVKALSSGVRDALDALDADVDGLLARGLLRVLAIAIDRYERLLDEHAVLDFPGMLARAVTLLERQEEFARSRLKLQSRYHHVLVDEFQDTSRAQWRLIDLLIAAWGEGEGASDAPTSIFVVGDRKQSIYRFRQAEATLLEEAARRIARLRPGRPVRQAITHSFRAVPELLAFVNALAEEIRSGDPNDEAFRYDETDRFVLPAGEFDGRRDGVPVVGLIAEPTMARSAAAVAAEIARLLDTGVVRQREGPPRNARPDDVAILFRARSGHQFFEEALEARGIRTYVYKGLGFFDVPEVQDLQALLRYLAEPESDLRAAELLRSRLIRISDAGLVALAPAFARALRAPGFDADLAALPLDDLDRRFLTRARTSVARWLEMADRVPPSEVVDAILHDAAYAYEMRGRRLDQARENVKKVRALIRRVESRGYATLVRLADYFETLRAGEESNAVVAASGCVNLMTIHAAKGLEFPYVFVVNLHVPGRGRPAGFSVIERGPDGSPEVAFGPSEATRLEEQREAEELRRLFYVAATRARDRLYFATEVDETNHPRRGARSMAALLPASLSGAFAAAAASADRAVVDWPSSRGTFALAVCRAPETLPVAAPPAPPAAPDGDTAAIPVDAAAPVAVTANEGPADDDAPSDGRLIGTLVHRLFQRRVDPGLDEDALAAAIESLARPDELSALADPLGAVRQAAALYSRLARQPDVASLLAEGQCFYEVPFTVQTAAGGRPLRGVIDCLVVSEGTATVVEFKTGRPKAEHEAQAAVYREAIGTILPGMAAKVRIVYP